MNKDIDVANGKLEEALGNVRYCYRMRIDALEKELNDLKEQLRKAFFDESADVWEILAKIRKELKKK